VAYLHSTAEELYFARLLLNHVKRALSSEDLKKVSGVIYPTFQLACKTLGFLGDDKEWDEAFYEVIVSFTSQQLGQLFVSIYIYIYILFFLQNC
jgi:hypothetical protein